MAAKGKTIVMFAPSLKRLVAAFPSVDPANLRKIRTIIRSGRVAMREIDTLLANHGVEYIADKHGNTVARYSNSGDTYAPTILYAPETHTYRLTTVGDFVEAYERRHARLP